MQRIRKYFVCGSLLDNPPSIHHCNAISCTSNNTKVMGDKYDSRAECSLKFANQFKNLRLNRNVQCCSGFICKQNLGTTQ
jgi:hypothetical protein